MLGDVSRVTNIYLVTGFTDMRKSIDGLFAIVKDTYGLDPYSNSLFLFCGRRADRLKALVHDKLSVDFCYPHIFRLIRKTRSLNDMYFVKCADNTF